MWKRELITTKLLQRESLPILTSIEEEPKYKAHKLHQTSGVIYVQVLYLLACQERVTIDDSGLFCHVYLTSFEQWLTPLTLHRRSWPGSVIVTYQFCTQYFFTCLVRWHFSSEQPQFCLPVVTLTWHASKFTQGTFINSTKDTSLTLFYSSHVALCDLNLRSKMACHYCHATITHWEKIII